MGREKVMRDVKDFVDRVKGFVNLDEILLFGSRARKDENKDSDVDLIIISKDFKGKKHFRRAAPFYLAWDSDYDVDIVCLTPEEFKKKKGEVGTIKEASREAIKI